MTQRRSPRRRLNDDAKTSAFLPKRNLPHYACIKFFGLFEMRLGLKFTTVVAIISV